MGFIYAKITLLVNKKNKQAKNKTTVIKIKKNIYTKKRRKYFYFSINILQCNSITISSRYWYKKCYHQFLAI